MGGTIRYTVSTHSCPHCDHRLIAGARRFGPAQVRCGRCGAVLETGFEGWADLSTGRRFAAAIEEILLPSFIGAVGCTGLLIRAITQLFLWVMAPFPLLLFAMIVDPNLQSGFAAVLMVLGSFVYPGLLVARLIRMIRESQAYTLRGVIPVWGKNLTEAQTRERTVTGRYLDRRYRMLLRLLALALTAVWFGSFLTAMGESSLMVAGRSDAIFIAGFVIVHIVGAVVVAELLRCLGSGNAGIVIIAVLALLFAPVVLPSVALFAKHRVSSLIRTLTNSNAALRRGKFTENDFAIHTETYRALLDVRTPTAVEPLLKAMRDRDEEIREIAATVLGEIGDRKALLPLIQALVDDNGAVRAAAATALGKLGDAQAAEALTVALHDEHDSVRSAATQALAAISTKAGA